MKNIESNKGEIVMYQPDETIRLEVRMGEETVWLTQQQMAELFDTDRSSINKHINNIFETEELAEEPTCAKIAQVRKEGKRMVKRQLVYYNLDMIISVGYRVNSKRGTKFRQWANQVLKDYLLKGYVVNQRITTLEHQVAELTEKVNFFVRSSLPPVEGIFYDGQIFYVGRRGVRNFYAPVTQVPVPTAMDRALAHTHQHTNTLTLRFLNIGKGNKQWDYIYYLIIYIL